MSNGEIYGLNKLRLKQIFDSIENGNWNKAKSIWILEFLQLKPKDDLSFCTFSNSYESFGRIMAIQQVYSVSLACEFDEYSSCIQSNNFYFHFNGDNSVRYSLATRFCRNCGGEMSEVVGSVSFLVCPSWLYFDVHYEINDKRQLTCLMLPMHIRINNLDFKLIMAQIIVNSRTKNAHFKGIFLINEKFFLIDDLCKNNRNFNVPKKNRVTSCLYYIK